MSTDPDVYSAPTNDVFDPVVNLDDALLQQGFEDGFRDGVLAGKVEGREVGLQVGFQRGEELGFYRGCVDVWKAAMTRCPDSFPARSQKAILRFEEQLKDYPLYDPKDERLQDMLAVIRARFRAILAMLSVHIHYEGYPGSSSQMEERSSDF